MINYGNGVIEFDSLHNARSVIIHYEGRAIFYGKNSSYSVKKNRKKIIISIKKSPTSIHIIKYFGEFKAYNAVDLRNNDSIRLEAFGLSYWEQDRGKWEYDTVKWEDDNTTYTHIKKLGKRRNKGFRGY